MNKKEFWNIPNMMTSYRLLVIPLITYFIVTKQETLYAIFIVINVVTDFLDGIIARRFKMETAIGAKLDSFADNFTFLFALIGFLVFKMEDFRPHLISLFIFVALNLLTVVVSLIKFGKFPSFHGYMTKIGGYIDFIFFVSLFSIGFSTPLYFLMVFWGITGALEHLAIQMIIPEMRSNVKGIYWVVKEYKTQRKGEI